MLGWLIRLGKTGRMGGIYREDPIAGHELDPARTQASGLVHKLFDSFRKNFGHMGMDDDIPAMVARSGYSTRNFLGG